MGLDMYLYAEKVVSGYEHSGEARVANYRKLLEAVDGVKWAAPDTPLANVSITIGYWRKANQIHQWFVENVQDGTDDCGTYHVGRDKLNELLTLCKHVLGSTPLAPGMVHTGTVFDKDRPEGEEVYEEGEVPADSRVAREALPTTAGFFFGSTDYDEFYWQDINDTIEQIERVITLPLDWEIKYASSW